MTQLRTHWLASLALFSSLAMAIGRSGDVTLRWQSATLPTWVDVPDVALPVTLFAISALGLSVWALRAATPMRRKVIAASALALLAFTWVGTGATLNMVSVLRGAVLGATPLTFGALAGLMGERAGVINIAIEAQFLFAAFSAALVASVFDSATAGLAAAALAGVAVAALLGLFSLRHRADQIVIGFVLVLLAQGVTGFAASAVMAPNPALNSPARLSPIAIPVLSEIPVIGPVLFRHSALTYLAVVALLCVHWLLTRSRFGLRVNAVGEAPHAADAVGIDVLSVRWRAILIGGLLAGIGGAYFSIASGSQFSDNMTAGRGFIALAAVIVGGWRPAGVLFAGLLFGLSDGLADALSLGADVSVNYLRMLPYVATIIIVAGFIGRVRPPAAGGSPWPK